MYLFLFLTLYVFRAHRAHHQERQIVSIQPLAAVTLCRWPCHVQVVICGEHKNVSGGKQKIKQHLTFTLYIHASYHQGFWCKQFLRKILWIHLKCIIIF